jgi:hypothetical protein
LLFFLAKISQELLETSGGIYRFPASLFFIPGSWFYPGFKGF